MTQEEHVLAGEIQMTAAHTICLKKKQLRRAHASYTGYETCYRLLQAKQNKLCQPRMPHAVATRMPYILSIVLTTMNSERG